MFRDTWIKVTAKNKFPAWFSGYYQWRPQVQLNSPKAAMDEKLQKLGKSGFLSSGAPTTQLNLHIHIRQHLVYKGK